MWEPFLIWGSYAAQLRRTHSATNQGLARLKFLSPAFKLRRIFHRSQRFQSSTPSPGNGGAGARGWRGPSSSSPSSRPSQISCVLGAPIRNFGSNLIYACFFSNELAVNGSGCFRQTGCLRLRFGAFQGSALHSPQKTILGIP